MEAKRRREPKAPGEKGKKDGRGPVELRPVRTSRYMRDDLSTMLRRVLVPSSPRTSSVPNKVHHRFRRFQAFMQLPPSQFVTYSRRPK